MLSVCFKPASADLQLKSAPTMGIMQTKDKCESGGDL